MNKIEKNGILAIVGFYMLMMMAASVSADEELRVLDRQEIDTVTVLLEDVDDSPSIEDEPNLISPGPGDDGESLIIAPAGNSEYEDTSPEENRFTTGLLITIGIAGLVGLGAALIIFRNKF